MHLTDLIRVFQYTAQRLVLSNGHLLVLAVFAALARCDNAPIISRNGDQNVSECNHCSNNSSSGESVNGFVHKSSSQIDCLSGRYMVVVINDNCQCEHICARTTGQPCYLSSTVHNNNNKTSLCDSALQLKCNALTNLCQGSFDLKIVHLQHQSFYLNFLSNHTQQELSNNSHHHNGSQVRISLAPYHSPQTPEQMKLIPIKTHFVPAERNRVNVEVNNLQANSTYIVEVQNGVQQEFAIVRTNENPIVDPLPKVLVTHRTASSISIAFDDFKPPNYNKGYGIKYRFSNNLSNQTWNIKSSNSTFYVLSQLKPATAYQIQVFILDNFGDQVRSNSEILNVSTLDGCLHHNNSYLVGQKIFEGCDQVCLCLTGGTLSCTGRCIPPHITVNEAKAKRLDCKPLVDDVCCMNCQAKSNISESKPFIDKPGECSPPGESSIHSNDTCNGKSTSSSNECTHDYHCTGMAKCCRNGCGTLSCQPPWKASSASLARCPFVCGLNSVCQYSEEDSVHKCVCLDGFHGEDPIRGCTAKFPSRKHQCEFEGKTYQIGQSFEHNCQRCVCSEALEVECKTLCKEAHNHSQPLTSNCRLVEDPNQPACCKKKICEPATIEHQNTNKVTNGTTVVTNSTSHHLQSGCRHLDHMYQINETFTIDCELKCICKLNGEIECLPRCFADPGFDENFCHLVQDPDDPECCKISICDFNSTSLKAGVIIEMAESINSTSLKLRIVLNGLPNNTTSLDHNGTLFYRKLFPNETEQTALLAKWNNITLYAKDKVVVSNHSFEVLLVNLSPETDYLIHYDHYNVSSNSVFVRTFPPGINNTFKGCFHGNQIIQVGELFYEGDCEYKCICREGGFRECEERCPVYVDLIGYENCHWEPSSEDICCTVPVCPPEHPNSAATATTAQSDASVQCQSTKGESFKVGQQWIEGSGCLQKNCTCVLNNNASTGEIKCRGGCSEIPASVLKPSEDCPSPRVITPKDLCVCPYVVCSNNINPLDLPDKAAGLAKGSSEYCEFKGEKIQIGFTIADGCRASCKCEPGALLNCKPIQCSHNFGPLTAKCIEWDIDPHFVPVPPNCCPEPKCKNDGSCSFAGIRFANNKHIPQELLPCGKRCVCNSGEIFCENLCPDVSEHPPLGLPCPPSLAFRGHLPGDKCCIHWQCRSQHQHRIKGTCVYKDKRFKLGEQWDETETSIKRRCQCKMTSGIFHVVCNPGNCQPIIERYLEPTPECLIPTVVVPKDPIICPYVVCNNTKIEGSERDRLDNVDILAINATSARIRFSIPQLLVGLLGHAEVHFTTDLDIPRNQWNIQKFARPKRMFDIPNIEYHLGNLRPDTTYFLQVEVIIEALKSGPISDIITVYQPPLEATPSTTTTTTTTTLPPIIMLDMNLAATIVDYNSVKLSWRPFTIQEKKFIDGVRIRYKIADHEAEDWTLSGILHRNTNHYIITNLEPGTTYAIDLLFVSVDSVNSNIVSTKPVVAEIPLPPKDPFQFSPHIYPDDVAINDGKIDIEVRNLPRPVIKYIHLAKLCYQNIQTSELRHNFSAVDESARFSYFNLLSNTRYKVWIDFYLTNGQVISSNSIDIITKYKQRPLDANNTDALLGKNLMESKYLLSFMLISVFFFVLGSGFMLVTCFMRRHSTAAISRACISEAAYDNPTYKTFEAGEKSGFDDSHSKSGTLPAK